MNLYYEVGDQQVGPIGTSELQSLVKAKKLNARTMVWQEGMGSWEELSVFVRNRQGKGNCIRHHKLDTVMGIVHGQDCRKVRE